MSSSATHRVFRVLGTTDTHTTCDLCGREELKGTIALQHLADDGSSLPDITYAGSDCGRRAAGWTAAELRTRVRAAADATRAAADAERERLGDIAEAASMDRVNAFIAAHGLAPVAQMSDLWGKLPAPLDTPYRIGVAARA